MSSPTAITFTARCAGHARRKPDHKALVFVDPDNREHAVHWADLDRLARKAAITLQRYGVNENTVVVIALPSCEEHFYATYGSWWLGACVLPVNPDLPLAEREAMLGLTASWRKIVYIGATPIDGHCSITPSELMQEQNGHTGEVRECVPRPGKAIGSGGSTGRPKLIVDPKPWLHVPGKWGGLTQIGLRPDQTTLIAGRLYHNMGFLVSHVCLFEGHTLVMPEKFKAEQAARLIQQHGIQFTSLLPIMMQRMAKLPEIRNFDFSSIEGMYHSGGACPDWVKRIWLELVGAEKLWEAYGSTEEKGVTLIRGDEWLHRPGSVGKPHFSDICIKGDQGERLPAGEVGEIFMRNIVDTNATPGSSWPEEPTCEYIGAPPPVTDSEGFASVGDMGSLDEEGYLYLADRRVDMIVSGGANVFPAEVEAAISEHSKVADVVVIGVPDEEWGNRVHAIVETNQVNSPSVMELDEFCRERLVSYKVPKSYEFLVTLPRDPSGKIRRQQLREERNLGWTEAMLSTVSKAVTTNEPATNLNT